MSNTPKTLSRVVVLWLLTVSTVVTVGCGDGRPRRVPVSGIVRVDGEPIAHGFIMFMPSEGRSATGQIDGQGRFTLSSYQLGDGVTVGTHKVEVLAKESVSETAARWHAPKKYANHATSGITFDIKGPTDNLEVDLTWDGGKPFIETDE